MRYKMGQRLGEYLAAVEIIAFSLVKLDIQAKPIAKKVTIANG